MIIIFPIGWIARAIASSFYNSWSSLENEIADEWIHRDAKKKCECCADCTSRYGAIRALCPLIFFLCMSLVSMGVLWAIAIPSLKDSTTTDNSYYDGPYHYETHTYHNDQSTDIILMVVPAAIVVLFVSLIIMVCCICGCKYTCKTEPPQDVKVTAANLHQAGIYTLKHLPREERLRILREAAPEPNEATRPEVV